MQIISIHLKNIKSHRELDLTFSPGINVLSGANGVGKSTIFEALGYALFGVDAQSFVGNVERFITIGAKRGDIAVVFLIDDDRYRVSRTVGTPAKWLLAKEVGGDFEVEEHKDAKETEGRLKELLGLDNGRSLAEQFELVIGPFQNEFLGPFVTKQVTKRRDKFDEILGIDAWRKTYTETKVLVSTIKGKVDALNSAIAPLKDQVAVLPERREAHKDAKQQLVQTEQELVRKGEGLKALEAQLGESDKREQAVKELTTAINTLKERIGNGREKISSQKTLIDEADKSQKIVAANSAGKQAFEQAEQRLGELREQVKVQRQLEQEVTTLDKQVAALVVRHASEERTIALAGKELQSEEQDLADKRKALALDEKVQQLAARLPEIRKSIDGVRVQIGRLDGRRTGLEEGSSKLAEGVCPFFQEPCLNIAEKPPGDVFSAKFAELEVERNRLKVEQDRLSKEEGESTRASEQIKSFEVQLKWLEEHANKLITKRKANEERASGLEALRKDQSTVQQQLVQKQTALKGFNTLAVDIDACEALKTEHQTARDLYVANQEQVAKLEERQVELRKFEQLLDRCQAELAGKEDELVTASKEYDAGQHQSLREQKDTLGREVGALGQKITGLKADVARLAGEIDKLKQLELEIATKQAQIKAYGEKEELVKFLRNRVFNKVSAYLSERFREEISQRANRIYRIIAEVDEELAWGDDYRIVLRDMVDGELRERADDQLSGGQTMSAVVALRLAMLQTIGARIAFFDEPTSNLDATRRENLAHAFRAIDVGKEEVTEHWYDQLFLISHDVAFTEVTDQIVTLD
jgi:exonuclease SbcC